MELRKRYNDKHLQEFSNKLIDLSSQIGFKVSARGWAYLMEQHRLIDKDQFDKVNDLINSCRKKGYLPIDFVAEESARQFDGVISPSTQSIYGDFADWLSGAMNAVYHYDIDWWADERYYIQMVVEKVDLVTLFAPVCKEYKIPIANSKGWSSMLQRAEYARRFKNAEDNGLECVLLYCGDHDPDGLRIGEFLRKNLEDISDVSWEDGYIGYNPENLIIDRFGLNYDFIIQNEFTWIDNLITGSGKDLASAKHKNFKMPYVQDYLKEIGERKCEANVIVTMPKIAREFCTGAIHKYLGSDAKTRFKEKKNLLLKEFETWLDDTESREKIESVIRLAKRE